MSQTTESTMKKISLEKVVLNMGVGKSGDIIDVASNAIIKKIISKNKKLN